MTTFTNKMTDADIVAGIQSIGNRQRSIRVDIQKLLVSITLNWARDGAVNVCAQRMTDLLGQIDGAHAQKLVNWCNAHCSFTLEEDADGNNLFAYDSKVTTLSPEKWGEIKAVNMFDFTPDEPPKAFNFKQKLAALIAAAEKRGSAKAEKRSEDDEIPQAQLAAAKALLSSFAEVTEEA